MACRFAGRPPAKEGWKTNMPLTTNRQRLLTNLIGKDKGQDQGGDLPVLDQFLYAVCREGVTREEADQAFAALQERFFDWNEVRVSSHREIEEVLDDLPGAGERAQRLISFLQEVFETTFSFDLESLKKKPMKQAAKQISRYEAANDYIVAWVTQKSFAGHAVPLDAPALRVVQRVGLIDAGMDSLETARATMEHFIPKSRDAAFCDNVSNIASQICFEEDPDCSHCPLLADCPTGQENARTVHSGRGSRPKSR
jgi:endonuclease-3